MELESRILTLPGEIAIEILHCPAGRFFMGSAEGEVGRDTDERRHAVIIKEDFWLGRFQVTQSLWECVMGECPSQIKGGLLPVMNVTFTDCLAFANAVSEMSSMEVGLPTEAEWEYACRAGTETAYGLGAEPDFKTCADGPVPVTQCRKNAWGFAGMHGNVFEWCSDWYDADYGLCNDTRNSVDAKRYRVLRGGCWSSGAEDCRSAFRDRADPAFSSHEVGFRICCRG